MKYIFITNNPKITADKVNTHLLRNGATCPISTTIIRHCDHTSIVKKFESCENEDTTYLTDDEIFFGYSKIKNLMFLQLSNG